VQLQQIDSIRFQALKCCIRCASDRFWRKILRNFPLTASARLTVIDEIVPDLGRDHDLVPLI